MSLIARLVVSIFFPQFKVLGCDVDQTQTPDVLKKISIAATRDRSYEVASRNLHDLAELEVSAKQCQRVAIRIGNERLEEQAQRMERYSQATLPERSHGQPEGAPQNDWSGRVAVVQADGGRVQIRDELWGKEKPGDKKHRWWRETQTGCLQTYLSKPSDEDPHAEVPESLKDPLWAIPKFKEIHRQRGSRAPDDTSPRESALETGTGEQEHPQDSTAAGQVPVERTENADKDTRWSGGEPLVKSVIVTRQGYDYLGLSLASEAYHRGFNKAKSKAFMGDGLKVNWSIWERYFSHYVPITDLMHALSYVYSAAVACGATMEDAWALYLEWLHLVWAGKVLEVIAAMNTIAAEKEARQKESPEDLKTAITYLTNNASRMKYDQYRKAGLPISTSPVESIQKQVNHRIKGTEKFWEDENIEPLLQLIADDLSDTHDREAFWSRRRSRCDGFRHRQRKTKTKVS